MIENIQAILKEGGADLSHVVDMTVFLVDMKDYQGVCPCIMYVCVCACLRVCVCARARVCVPPLPPCLLGILAQFLARSCTLVRE